MNVLKVDGENIIFSGFNDLDIQQTFTIGFLSDTVTIFTKKTEPIRINQVHVSFNSYKGKIVTDTELAEKIKTYFHGDSSKIFIRTSLGYVQQC